MAREGHYQHLHLPQRSRWWASTPLQSTFVRGGGRRGVTTTCVAFRAQCCGFLQCCLALALRIIHFCSLERQLLLRKREALHRARQLLLEQLHPRVFGRSILGLRAPWR